MPNYPSQVSLIGFLCKKRMNNAIPTLLIYATQADDFKKMKEKLYLFMDSNQIKKKSNTLKFLNNPSSNQIKELPNVEHLIIFTNSIKKIKEFHKIKTLDISQIVLNATDNALSQLKSQIHSHSDLAILKQIKANEWSLVEINSASISKISF